MQENQGGGKAASGIYKWTNKINGKIYIGSAINLPKRLYAYYSDKHMETHLKIGRSAIFSAICKHGGFGPNLNWKYQNIVLQKNVFKQSKNI